MGENVKEKRGIKIKNKRIIKKLTLGEIIRGIAVGILITNIISLVLSALSGTNTYLHTAPELTEKYNSEIYAVLYQFILSAILGIYFEYAAVIWEFKISTIKKFVLSYVFCIPAVMVIAYLCYWAKHTFIGVITYLSIYSVIFLLIQYLIYIYNKRKV